MAEDKDEKSEKRPIIIKKIRKMHGSRGWKPAPTHFVAALIPFFLLAWLLATASPQARQAVADYFQPQAALSGGGAQR